MNGEPTTTERIWELLSDKLRSFLLQRVSDEHVAEDLLQETFIRIHRKLNDIDDKQRIISWVFQIAHNLVIDHYRAKSPTAKSMMDEPEAHENEVENLNDLVAGWLPQMVAQLPDKYREAVQLYEIDGISQQKIAEQLGISLSGAKSRVQRGREKLKSLLFECCSFERDQHGNVLDYDKNSGDTSCEESCDC